MDNEKAQQEMWDEVVASKISEALSAAKLSRGEGRSERSRHYAIVITDLEKALAYHKTFVMDAEDPGTP